MNRVWFLQANPKHYDIDAALTALDRIWWRVPQYTSEIQFGDVVVVWRSGKEAGIVGIGRVVAEPQLRSMDPAEKRFALSEEEEADDVTRALIHLRKVPRIVKEQVRSIPELHEHQIVRAPMGTVFPISDEEWAVLRRLLPPPPEPIEQPGSALPPPFAWQQRSKGVLPMPGGYSGYLDSLSKVCSLVSEERPSPSELAIRLEDVLGVKATAARLRESFLRKVGIITVQGGVCRLSNWARKWRETGDGRIIAALLHSRCQLIGELLEVAREPRSNEDLLGIANEHYGMGWDTQTQIANRRGWLQSAGMLAVTDEGKIQTTATGRALSAELTLHVPGITTVAPEPLLEAVPEAPIELAAAPAARAFETIVNAIKESATDSAHPGLFEQAVRDAFAFLGFHAEWLGGSGKTDVLLDAMLGKDDSYRVIVDCKTCGSGTLNDQQVDWVTLGEHKVKHDAQHVAVVAPDPTGARLFARAEQHAVTVISVDQLAGLCRQHAKTPLGLDDYRLLFAHGGVVDSLVVDERAEEVKRITALAAAICDAIRIRSVVFGRLSARDLFLILAADPVADGTTEDELQGLLETLSSPLLRVLDGSPPDGYRVTTSAQVARMRLDVVAEQLAASAQSREESMSE